MLNAPIAVLGSGSWGTALAIQFARAGKPTRLWGRDAGAAGRHAQRPLQPPLSARCAVSGTAGGRRFAGCRAGRRHAMCWWPCPAAAFAPCSRNSRRGSRPKCASPGPPRASNATPACCRTRWRMKCWAAATPWPCCRARPSRRRWARACPPRWWWPPPMRLSPCAWQKTSPRRRFRTYVSTDIMGVEIGGAVKNVIAIGAGLSDGLGFGANMRVALITRGLNEMTRLGVALGRARAHVHGAGGPRRPGAHLHRRPVTQPPLRPRAGARPVGGRSHARDRAGGRGLSRRARAARRWPRGCGLDLPICEGICRILFDGANAGEVVRDLMARPPQAEFE